MNIIHKKILTLFVFIFLTACNPQATPISTLTSTPSPSVTPSPTSSSTPTLTPTITSTVTLTPTPTEIKLAYQPIDTSNASKMALLNILGFGFIDQIKYSPDGSQIAVVSRQKTCIFDAATLEEISCVGITPRISHNLLSDDFSKLLMGGAKEFSVLNIADSSITTQELPQRIYEDRNPYYTDVFPMAFSRDNRYVVFFSANECLAWDLETNQELPYEKSAGCNPYYDVVSFSPDGQYLLRNKSILYSDKDYIEILSFPDFTIVKNIYPDMDHTDGITFSPDGQFFVVKGAADRHTSDFVQYGGGTKYANVYTITGKFVHARTDVDSYGFFKGGSGYYEIVKGMMRIYDTTNWITPLSEVKSNAWAAVSPDGSSGVYENMENIEFWKLDPSQMIKTIPGKLSYFGRSGNNYFFSSNLLRFTPDNRAVWVGLNKYDVLTGKELKRIDLIFKSAGLCTYFMSPAPEEIIRFDISLDEHFAAYLTDCSRLVLLDLLSGQEYTLRPFGAINWENVDLLFTPDSRYLLYESKGKTTLYDLSDLDHPIAMGDGFLISWIRAGAITFSEDWTRESLHEHPLSGEVVDPDGNIYHYDIMPDTRHDWYLINPKNTPVPIMTDQKGTFRVASFFPGTPLILGIKYLDDYSENSISGLWNVESGKQYFVFPFTANITQYYFNLSPDGTLLTLSAPSDYGFQIWGIPHQP